jgi:uncharacterized membrane protein YphA (DoxX/SURF4 family)
MTVYTLFLYIGIIALFLTLTLGVGHAKLKKYAKMQPALWFVQYFVGCLLIFSGLVKAVDPLGTAYKMADYFTLLLPALSFIKPYALPFALVMIVLEIVLGINLILGHGKRWTTSLNLLMMLFFTFLTGYNYLTGYLPEGVGFFEFGKWQNFMVTSIKVSDCGCFGDFMKLLPIETFMKDVILTGMSIFIFLRTKDMKFLIGADAKIAKVRWRDILTTFFTIAVTIFCYMNFFFGLPMVDFRPFKIGTNLGLARAECEKNPSVIKRLYTYKNRTTGKSKIIDADEIAAGKHNYLFNDSTILPGATEKVAIWKSDSTLTKDKIIVKGCDSKIAEMDASKQQVFATHGYALWIVADEIDPSYKGPWNKVKALTDAAKKDGINSVAMYHHIHDSNRNADEKDDLELFQKEMGLSFPFLQSDEKLVKTIIRSSPGVILLYNGTVVMNWHHRQLPNWDYIKMTYVKKFEPTFVADVKVTDFMSDTKSHTIKCKVEKTEKGKISATSFDLVIFDGNNELLNQLIDLAAGNPKEGTFKMSFSERPELVSKNPNVNLVPNGFLDNRKAYQILEIKQ